MDNKSITLRADFTKAIFLGADISLSTYSSVNHALHTLLITNQVVSMCFPSLVPGSKCGSVSKQKQIMDSTITATDKIAVPFAAIEELGCSNRTQSLDR